MKLTEKQKKMKVDWDSYERAKKALDALFLIKRDKRWKRI